MVESRWAMMMDVRPSTMRASASRTRNSVSVSTLDVASSKIRNLGWCARARAKLMSCFCPVESELPRFLILDEATSSVDTETELRVREALANMVEGRTSIVIAHRLSTIQRADRILVMHKGQLRESGAHQELLALRGIYWKLYQLQYKDQEIRQPR